MDQAREIELVFAPQEDGGYDVYAPDLPGLHTQGDTLEEATANAGSSVTAARQEVPSCAGGLRASRTRPESR
jgi:predicted RNase H-like HicB family nuclease